MNTPLYPGPDTLCEDCGYALRDLPADGGCPECGLPIADSSPVLRTEPDWQLKAGPVEWFEAVLMITTTPKAFFRAMRVGGSNIPARLFLIITTCAIGMSWFGFVWAINGGHLVPTMMHALIVSLSVIVLSYIEAVGVVFFSRRRDWRVPFKLAERLVCYSSIGWIPAAVVMGLAWVLVQDGIVDNWMRRLLGTWEHWQSLALLVLFAAVAMMWFEVLVWMGVRQTKHANT